MMTNHLVGCRLTQEMLTLQRGKEQEMLHYQQQVAKDLEVMQAEKERAAQESQVGREDTGTGEGAEELQLPACMSVSETMVSWMPFAPCTASHTTGPQESGW